MLPLVSQVEDTIRHPITLFPPGIRDGVKVVVVIDALSCDRPAAISMVGAAHQSNKEGFCTRCHAAMSELKERRCESCFFAWYVWRLVSDASFLCV